MKRVLVLGAGGSASTNYIRSLRMAKEDFLIVGTDSNKYYLQRAEVDTRYLVPLADSPDYIPVLNRIIDKTGAEFIHAQNDAEVQAISDNRLELNAKTFLPPYSAVRICQDKWESRVRWEAVGIKHPFTFLIKSESDLTSAFLKLNGDVWIRDIHGAGGRGSFRTNDLKEAKEWIKLKDGWGHYTMAEYLSEKTTTFTTIWKDGVLIAGQGRKRLYWELGAAFVSGVSGATGGGIVDNDSKVVDVAIESIKAIDPEPNGIYSVDLTYGKDGLPYPTEINIGRFFTTHLFFAKAGLNMAYLYTKLGFGEKVGVQKINPLREGLVWIRGIDFEPVITTMEIIDGVSDNPDL